MQEVPAPNPALPGAVCKRTHPEPWSPVAHNQAFPQADLFKPEATASYFYKEKQKYGKHHTCNMSKCQQEV